MTEVEFWNTRERWIEAIGLLLIVIVGGILATINTLGYSTYGKPSEFGNATNTTCKIGGDLGIVNCTGNFITSLGKLGIGTDQPGYSLTVVGNTSLEGNVSLRNITDCNSGFALGTDSSGEISCIVDLNTGATGDTSAADDWNYANNLSVRESSYYTFENLTGSLKNSSNITFSVSGGLVQFFVNGSIGSGSGNCSGDLSCGLIVYASNFSFINSTAWITPAVVADIDKENIEGDLNTFVDIGGDTMTGDLLGTNIKMSGEINSSSGFYYQGQLLESSAANITSIATTAPITGGTVTDGAITIAITQAGSSSNGYLDSTDWNTFNNKLDTDSNAKTLCGDNTYLNGLDSTTCDSAGTIVSSGGIVSDTSPQLGGYLDTNGQNLGSTTDEIENVYIGVNNKIYLGDGQEGEIYYDGTKLVIKVN